MNFNEFKNILEEDLKLIEYNNSLSEEQMKKLYNYMKILIERNKEFNLTAITDEKEIILKHFVDSMTIGKYIESGKSLIDVGTGAGFPRKRFGYYRM